MQGEVRKWLELPASLIDSRGLIRVLDGPDADLVRLARQLKAGEYPRPFVVEEAGTRRLHFTAALVQSEMSLAEPYALHLAYTRVMMAGLLFCPPPEHLLIVGLGGGSLTKFCHRQLPRSRITTLELSADVIALGEQFFVPPADARLCVLQADAREWFAHRAERAELILLDAYDENGIPPGLEDEAFYRDLFQALTSRGVLVCNLAYKDAACNAHLKLLREVFAERVLCVEVGAEGNRVAFAFAEAAPWPPDWARAEREVRAWRQRGTLELAATLAQLKRAAQRRRP